MPTTRRSMASAVAGAAGPSGPGSTAAAASGSGAVQQAVEPPVQQEEEVVWHAHYQDPRAQVIFRTEDGISYRVSAFYLGKHSSVFSEMIDGSAAYSFEEPIDIDLRSPQLDVVLKYIYYPNSWSPDNNTLIRGLDLASFYPVLDFAERFDCEHMVRSLQHNEYGWLRGGAPWELLQAAGERRDIGVAKLAIKHFSETSFRADVFSKLETLPLSWQVELMRCMMEDKPVRVGHGPKKGGRGGGNGPNKSFLGMRLKGNPKVIAEAFNPKDEPNPNSDPSSKRRRTGAPGTEAEGSAGGSATGTAGPSATGTAVGGVDAAAS